MSDSKNLLSPGALPTTGPVMSKEDVNTMKRKRIAHPGYLNIFDLEHNALVIHVQEGRELHIPGKGRGDPYVKTYIMPDPKKNTKRKLSIKPKCADPIWGEEIRYPITNVANHMNQILQISVWDANKVVLMGRTSIKMSEVLPPKTGLIGWFELFQLPQGDTAFKVLHIINPKDYHIALYDYTPGCDKELLLRKDDLIKIVRAEKDWTLVESAVTTVQGFVPNAFIAPNLTLEAEAWFFGKISRSKAEKLLNNPMRKHGCFLIRESESQPGQYALSMKDGDSARHYRIETVKDGKFHLQGSSSPDFASLQELVTFHKQKRAGLTSTLKDPCPKEAQAKAADLSYDTQDKWEVPRESVDLVKMLGQGQYGEVYRGTWNGTVAVAVKTLKDENTDSKEFLEEAALMKGLKHKNLLTLYAVCTIGYPIFIITELMVNGALLEYLQSPAGESLRLPQLLDMGADVASGMAYLEDNGYIHRDLAARNILVGEENICKVADFGFAKSIKKDETYKPEVPGKFPVRWTAPEAISKYSIKSDVWSFGILLTELVTYGSKPYEGLDNAAVVSLVKKGQRMDRPPGCPEALYGIMLECWKESPEDRPTFASLHFRLEDFFTSETANYTDAAKVLQEAQAEEQEEAGEEEEEEAAEE